MYSCWQNWRTLNTKPCTLRIPFSPLLWSSRPHTRPRILVLYPGPGIAHQRLQNDRTSGSPTRDGHSFPIASRYPYSWPANRKGGYNHSKPCEMIFFFLKQGVPVRHCFDDNCIHTYTGYFAIHSKIDLVKVFSLRGKWAGNVHGRITGGKKHASPNNDNNIFGYLFVFTFTCILYWTLPNWLFRNNVSCVMRKKGVNIAKLVLMSLLYNLFY